ncbi:MFS general substrate transporter [Mytilinidion resinicola]|uniref:MFS general substrate transporter n=1 Tax=Mytilinidion resinicola TaxID=574789 RepID=A0A6A6Z8R9_9PEZI|nr:MFS general substrate transporter [Mytilinidion resinicola]KAF2817406.1 MFS general substrate transporter [Mytilinidion resinicola]
MADTKEDLPAGTVSHHEIAPEAEKPQLSHEEELRGRDFTISENDLPRGYFRSASFLGSMFAIGLSFGCGVGGFTLVAPILGFIDADIGPDPNLTWVAISYLLTNSVGLMLVGRLSDLFGRRWFFIGGNILATLGCIVAATAPNIPALIAGETLIGLGAASQLSYACRCHQTKHLKFLWGIPFSGFATAIGYAFVFQSSVGWRGVFYVLIAMNVASTLAWFLFYRPPYGRKTRFLKDFDYIGTFIGVLGLILLLMGLSWGGALHPWKVAHVIFTIVVGFVLMVAFVLYETFGNLKEPLLPIRLFRNTGWVITIIPWALGAAVYYALAILWASMVATLYSGGHSAMWAGWRSCLSNCGILFGEYCGAWGKRKTNYQIMVVFLIGSVLLASMATCNHDTPVRAMVLVFLAAAFIGYNEILNSTVATIVIDDQREIGTATDIAGSARSFISTMCSNVYTVVLTNRLAETIPARVPAALLAAGLPSTSIIAFLTAITAGTPAAWDASSSAYSTVFLTTIAFSGIGVMCSFFAPNVDHLLSKDVAVTLHERGTEMVVGGSDGEGRGEGVDVDSWPSYVS